MDALAYKMQSIGILFAVQELKVKDPLKEEFMSNNQLILQDRVLEDYPDSPDKSAEVGIVLLRENVEEYPGSFTVEVI